MDWWNILVFFVIPVLSVVVAFCFKRNYLWAAPLVSTAVSIIISIVAMPSLVSDNEARAMFFGISIPMQLGVVIGLTVIAYIVAYVRSRTHKNR